MSRSGTISVESAQDIVDEGAYVAMQEVSKHRWYTKRLVVFDTDPGLMGFHYLDPLSEIQEDQDRFVTDPVPTFGVVAREIVTTVYDVEP